MYFFVFAFIASPLHRLIVTIFQCHGDMSIRRYVERNTNTNTNKLDKSQRHSSLPTLWNCKCVSSACLPTYMYIASHLVENSIGDHRRTAALHRIASHTYLWKWNNEFVCQLGSQPASQLASGKCIFRKCIRLFQNNLDDICIVCIWMCVLYSAAGRVCVCVCDAMHRRQHDLHFRENKHIYIEGKLQTKCLIKI